MIVDPTPISLLSDGKFTDLGGTAGTENLQQAIRNDCMVNGVECVAAAAGVEAPATSMPATDFTNIIGAGAPKLNPFG